MTDQRHEYQVEHSLLYCLITDPAKIMDVELEPEDFSTSQFAQIYRAIKAVSASDSAVDVITVGERLAVDTGRDWLAVLTDLYNGVGSSVNVRAYAEAVRHSANCRRAKAIGEFLVENARKDGVIGDAIQQLMEIGRNRAATEYDLKQVLKLSVEEVDRAFRNQGQIVGVSTGLKDLDDLIGGYHRGDLTIIGARPATGKTAVMLNQIIGAKCSVGCISGEQGVAQLGQRMLAMTGKVSLMSMRNGRMQEADWPKLEAGAGILANHPNIKFNDRPAPTMGEIEACARRWKYEYDIKALYVDYLQRIKRDPKKPKHEAVGDNAARLKELARELDIPVIALAQVSRNADGRRPGMADLSDSSEIEKEADLIMLLYRDKDADGPNAGIIEFIIDKNRHGATGTVVSAWDARFLRVADLAEQREGYR